MRLVALALVWLAAGSAQADPTAEVSLFFDARVGPARPLIHASAHGRRVTLLVDTGAPQSALRADVARAAGVVFGADDFSLERFDGRTLRGARVGDLFTVGELGAVDGFVDTGGWLAPGRGEEARFDGVIAPLALERGDRALLIDLVDGKLASLPPSAARDRLGAYPLLLADGAGTDGEGHFLVDVRIDGEWHSFAVDTGAPQTLLYRARGEDLRATHSRFRARGAHVRVGAVDARITIEEREPVDGARPLYAGLLGMDVLRGCALLLDGMRLSVRCQGQPAATLALGPRMTRARRVTTQVHGPVLRQRVDGGYEYRGNGFVAVIDRTGHVEVRTVPATPQPQVHHADGDDRDERRWLRDETRDLQAELRADEERLLADGSLAGLPHLLDEIARDPTRSTAERRRLLYALWDDAVEPDDPTLGWAGRRARLVIERYVRVHLPAGSRDGFAPDELARLRAGRPRAPYFDPYVAPTESDRGELSRR